MAKSARVPDKPFDLPNKQYPWGQVVSVIQQKGGSGKTALTMSLAGYLGSLGHSVLVIDSDPQASAVEWFTKADEDSFPARVVSMAAHGQKLHRAAADMVLEHDVTFIDTPPNLQSLQPMSALKLSDIALVPMQLTPSDFYSSWHTRNELLIPGAEKREDLRVYGVITRYQKGLKLTRVMQSMIDDLGFPFFEYSMPQSTDIAATMGMGSYITEFAPEGKPAQAIRNIARELVDKLLTKKDPPLFDYLDKLNTSTPESVN